MEEQLKEQFGEQITLLIIDMQRDFVMNGAPLGVPGGEDDDKRTGELIKRIGSKVEITCTLDSHQPYHIAHQWFWRNSAQQHPNPFEVIHYDDVASGKMRPDNPDLFGWALTYTKTLQEGGRFPLVIWPDHCLISSHGACLAPYTAEAIYEWQRRKSENLVTFVTKGSYALTEHYGAAKAEVSIKEEPSTCMNSGFVDTIEQSKLTYFLGEASTHCVPTTMLDVTENFGEEIMQKIVFVEDCSSPVPGFEKQGEDALNTLIARGMRVERSDKIHI